jgi:AraC-like DNA-binding protein
MEPAWSIARFVEDVRTMSPVRDEPFVIDWLPNGRTSLVVRVPEEGRGDAHVVGPRTRAKLKRATGFVRATAIQFKPGWSASLFGVPANELTDQLVTLDDLWGAAGVDVTADLVAARSVPAMLDRLSRAVATRTTVESTSARLARRAVRMFEATEMAVEDVAKELGVTARHLRRAFVASVGIGPKAFARGVRLQRAISESARSRDWGAIARNAGYYDQAHLIGEFRDLVGLTPAAYLAR